MHARVGSIVGVVRVFVCEREISVVCVYVCAYCVLTVCFERVAVVCFMCA